jgi:hypothetical protein
MKALGIGARQPRRFPTVMKTTDNIARDAIWLNCY